MKIRTPNSNFTWYINSPNRDDLWFITLLFAQSRVIFIAGGSVGDLSHTTWEREFIVGYQKTTMGHWWMWNIYFPHRLVSWTTPPSPSSSALTPSSLNSPTCFHWSVRLREMERARGLGRYFPWTVCLSCRGKLWFQALLWHYFLFPHRQRTVGVISLIGIIMG